MYLIIYHNLIIVVKFKLVFGIEDYEFPSEIRQKFGYFFFLFLELESIILIKNMIDDIIKEKFS